MEASSLANQTLQFLEPSLTEDGHFNGLGSEELSLSEITTHASISPFLVVPPPLLPLSSREEITLTLDNKNASSSTPISFTNVSMSLARTPFSLRLRNNLDFPHTFNSTLMALLLV